MTRIFSIILLFLIINGFSIPPYPEAPLCTDHHVNTFHTLWNEEGCHYDHEHGQNPYTVEVANTFPGFDLQELLGGVQVGHTNPSSPMENTYKHGGFKFNVQLEHPEGCKPFEGGIVGVNGSVIQYHAFGDYKHELEAPIHSTAALFRQCLQGNPTDYGYVYTVQHQNYGQIVVPYQGTVFVYPYYEVDLYNSGLGPYISVNCIDLFQPKKCRGSLAIARTVPSDTVWTSKPTGIGERPESSTLFRLLFRARDVYQNFRFRDNTYPFTLLWLCSTNGKIYNPINCSYNNSTTQVHEISGVIPNSWDNTSWDIDPRIGRITAEGFTTRFGELSSDCTQPSEECFPIRLINAFTGQYGSVLVFTPGKGNNIVPYLFERDNYFCNGVPCQEDSPGAVPSGWIGSSN